MHPIYSALELRLQAASQAAYGSDEHRALMRVLVECADLVMPAWKHESPSPASGIRVTRRFGEGGKLRYGSVRNLFSRIHTVQRSIDYNADTTAYRVVGAALDVVHALMVPRQGYQTYGTIRAAYVRVNFGTVPAGDDYAPFRRDRELSDEFDAKVLAVLDKHIPIAA